VSVKYTNNKIISNFNIKDCDNEKKIYADLCTSTIFVNVLND